MGLDMYLYLAKYESVLTFHNANNYKAGMYPKELEKFEEEIAKRNFVSLETKCQVGYWRKANAIHNWFVNNCAHGVDDCRLVYVGLHNLEGLLQTVDDVLKDHSQARNLLPTKEGFFFGGTDYDEGYFKDLEYTKDLLTKVIDFLKNNTRYSCYYEASW